MRGSSPWGAGVLILASNQSTHTEIVLYCYQGDDGANKLSFLNLVSPTDLYTRSALTIPQETARWKLGHTHKIHFLFDTFAANIREKKKKKCSYEIVSEEPFLGRGEWNGMHADLVSISTDTLYMIILPAASTSFPFTFRSLITSSHSHLFPFQLLLILSHLRQ